MNGTVCQNTTRMSAVQNSERAISCCRIVQMQSQRQDLREGRCRSMCVVHSIFQRPWAPAYNIVTFLKRQGGVLMPDDQPVGCWRLVEKGGTKRNSRFAQNPLSDLQKFRTIRNPATSACLRAWRIPALLRGRGTASKETRNLEISLVENTPGIMENPTSSTSLLQHLDMFPKQPR